MKTEIIAVIRQILADSLELSGVPVGPETRFLEDLELDSLRSMALLAALAERLELRIDPMETVGLETVGELAELLAWKLERKA